jgi:hypothetical protein
VHLKKIPAGAVAGFVTLLAGPFELGVLIQRISIQTQSRPIEIFVGVAVDRAIHGETVAGDGAEKREANRRQNVAGTDSHTV